MSRSPPIAVLLNSYQGAEHVLDALHSVIDQTFGEWELLVYDDGSDDGTPELAESLDDPRIRVLRGGRNLGLGPARDAALAATCAPWVAWIDQDDLWLPHKLEQQWALAQDNSSGGSPAPAMVYGRALSLDPGGRLLPYERHFAARPLPEGDILGELARLGNFIPMSSVLVNRAALRAAGGVGTRLSVAVDYDMWVRLAAHGSLCAVQQPVMHYRLHERNMSRRLARQSHIEALGVLESVADRLPTALLNRRRRLYHSLIGYEDLRAGRLGQGLSRILVRGSLPWLLTRPLARSWRRLRGTRQDAAGTPAA